MTSPDPRMARAAAPVSAACDIAHVRFVRPDLDEAARFFVDFGLVPRGRDRERLVLGARRGFGPAVLVERGRRPAFRGFGLAVPAHADLERLSALPGAGPVEDAESWPGARQVRLRDPAGHEIRAVCGPAVDAPPGRPPLRQNLGETRLRLNDTQRPPTGPAQAQRLGHVVLNVVDFFASVRWYIETFGLIPSDVLTLPDGEPAVVFLRCDRGPVPVDHHTLVLAQNVVDGHGHSAFECIDVDDVAMGQEHLFVKGRTHAWGIGRHLLGSQMFDYWRDRYGDKFEHFVDSDLFTADRPTETSPLSSSGLYQWGPPLPSDFERPRLTPGFLWRAARNVSRSREMNFRRLRLLMRTMDAPARPWAR